MKLFNVVLALVFTGAIFMQGNNSIRNRRKKALTYTLSENPQNGARLVTRSDIMQSLMYTIIMNDAAVGMRRLISTNRRLDDVLNLSIIERHYSDAEWEPEKTTLQFVVENSRVAILKELLSRRAASKYKKWYLLQMSCDYSLLETAINRNSAPMVELLLEHGATTEVVVDRCWNRYSGNIEESKKSLLQHALSKKQTDPKIIRLLYYAGADIQHYGNPLRTALKVGTILCKTSVTTTDYRDEVD